MSRYIDADKAKKHFGDYFEKIGVARRYAESIIDNAIPTADVVEVRHGHWDEDMECSICGCLAPVSHVTGEEYAYEYCPNCGAKMDGKEQDHESEGEE